MKIFISILFSLFLTNSLFAFNLFGENQKREQISPTEQKTMKYNQQLISVNNKRSQIMRDFLKCMQKAHSTNETKACNSEKRRKMQSINYEKRKIYYNLKKTRLENYRNVMNNYKKNAKTMKNNRAVQPKEASSYGGQF